jgi:AraC-like DNA-binding protein
MSTNTSPLRIPPDQYAARLQPVMDAIRGTVAGGFEGTRFTDLARKAGLSPFHFHRRFRESFGITPKRAVVARQIDEAKRLIAEGMPLAEVATQCGFAHQSHLTARFHAIVGQSPMRWRRTQHDQTQGTAVAHGE